MVTSIIALPYVLLFYVSTSFIKYSLIVLSGGGLVV